MPGTLTRALGHAAGHVPGLRRVPVLKLLALADILLLMRDHVVRLEPDERRRLIELVRRGRGRNRNLSDREREELAGLIAKAEPRLFLGEAADKISPVPLPRRIVHGAAKKRA
jgi:hypothetical protein